MHDFSGLSSARGGFRVVRAAWLAALIAVVQAPAWAAEPARPAGGDRSAPVPSIRPVLAAAPSDSYVLGVGDLIRIQVYGEPDLTLQVRLESKGSISYPFLGEIRVVGRSVADVRGFVERGLADGYLRKPEVQVLVTEYRSFFVNGEVRRPGGYPFLPGLTVQKAVAVAGGLTERASTRKMFLIRENDPQAKRVRVDINAAILPGDTLVIEEGVF